jgi:hypothetical protein
MRKLKWIIPFFLIIVSVSSTIAQQCLSIVTEALARAAEDCTLTERNEVCYGYVNVIALPGADATTFDFDEQGDIAPFEQIGVMELSPFNEATAEWGVVIARVQAQLPDTLPGQNVTIVFFGGVSLQNEGVDDAGVQAFRFETGIGAERCIGLPPDGIIIDTPDDATLLTFGINGVEVTLGSTAFLQTFSPEGSDEALLRIGMLEGLGFISANGQTTRIADGEETTIPLDANLEANGAPSPASEFDVSELGVMAAFVESLEFSDSADTPETESVPCTVSTDTAFSAGLRVGPGENRTQRAWLTPNQPVTVTGVSDDGEWWQLDKFEAFPSGANSVVELWVNVNDVTATGDCANVGAADAPPIIAPPQPQSVSPTPSDDTDEPIVIITEDVPEPIIQIWTTEVEGSSRIACTNINWHIEYVSAMYLVGASPQPQPLSGINGSVQVCPRVTTTYYIRIVYTDGSQEDFPVVVRRAN